MLPPLDYGLIAGPGLKEDSFGAVVTATRVRVSFAARVSVNGDAQ
jgi:hypothetical protein